MTESNDEQHCETCRQLSPDEYRCEKCGEVFTKGWTDEESKAEQEANGWGDMEKDDLAIVCDDCYHDMTNSYAPHDFNIDQEKK